MKARPIDLSTVTAAQRKRFREKIDRSGDGCWLWTAGTFCSGYGCFQIGSISAGTRRNVLAHRLAWMLAHPRKQLSPEDFVLHRCDVPLCCRPGHCFIGSSADNVHDMIKKGRARVLRGEAHASSKITESDVWEICRSNENNVVLANRYGVVHQLISMIKIGLIWKHVPVKRAVRKGPKPRRLTIPDVKAILRSQETQVSLAAQYGVSFQEISKIKQRERWKHINPEEP